MRPKSPSNRISGYYCQPDSRQTELRRTGDLSAKRYHFAAPTTHRQQVAFARRVGGRLAGIAASLLQLAASALCVAGAFFTWLGYPVGISLTTAVFLGGVMFGTVSLLHLYSVLAGAASETALAAHDESRA